MRGSRVVLQSTSKWMFQALWDTVLSLILNSAVVVWMQLQWAVREQASVAVCSVTLFTKKVVGRYWFANPCCWGVAFKLGCLYRWKHRLSVGYAGMDSFKDINFHILSFHMSSFLKMICLRSLSGLPVLLSDGFHNHLSPTFERKAYPLSILNLSLVHCLGV